MALPPVPPRFQPRQHTQGGDWYIFVVMPNGDTAFIDGFGSEAEAELWIETESASWERNRPGPSTSPSEEPAPPEGEAG